MKEQETIMEAEASGFIHLRPDTVRLIKEDEGNQDSMIRRAETAGQRAAGNTGKIIPLIQPVTLTAVEVRAYVYPNGVEIKCIVRSAGQTGLETEALTAVSIALLTLFENCKATDSSAALAEIRITRKTHPEG
jgi:cyclic pyranopterin monophosphate synthase